MNYKYPRGKSRRALLSAVNNVIPQILVPDGKQVINFVTAFCIVHILLFILIMKIVSVESLLVIVVVVAAAAAAAAAAAPAAVVVCDCYDRADSSRHKPSVFLLNMKYQGMYLILPR